MLKLIQIKQCFAILFIILILIEFLKDAKIEMAIRKEWWKTFNRREIDDFYPEFRASSRQFKITRKNKKRQIWKEKSKWYKIYNITLKLLALIIILNYIVIPLFKK